MVFILKVWKLTKIFFFFRGKRSWCISKYILDFPYTSHAEQQSVIYHCCDNWSSWQRNAVLTSGLLSDLEVRMRSCFLLTFLTPQVWLASSSWLYVKTACSSWSVLFRGFIIYLWSRIVKYPLWDTEAHIWKFSAIEPHVLTRMD